MVRSFKREQKWDDKIIIKERKKRTEIIKKRARVGR